MEEGGWLSKNGVPVKIGWLMTGAYTSKLDGS